MKYMESDQFASSSSGNKTFEQAFEQAFEQEFQ